MMWCRGTVPTVPTLVLACVLYLLSTAATTAVDAAPPPNVVLIMADDLGMGDVGAFGNTTLRTPSIDRIAREGVRLEHSIAAASVCTPSRAAFLTGRYPIRMGLVPTNIVRVNLFVSSISGLPRDEITVGELAQQKGYTTGFIGKWHLGVHCSNSHDFCHHPNQQGFDYYYGVPLTNLKDFGPDEETVLQKRLQGKENTVATGAVIAIFTMLYCFKSKMMSRLSATLAILVIAVPVATFLLIFNNLHTLNGIVMRDREVVEQPIHLEGFAKRLSSEGVKFLEKRKQDDKPFLLVMSWLQVHTAMHASREYQGLSAHGPYGDNVEEMDASVGHILAALDTLGFANNTFVYFTSDNGGHVEEVGRRGNREGGYNGIYRGGKMQGGMDGGIRVPTVARFPGTIPPGGVLSLPVSLMDVFPTVASVIQASVPRDRQIDGVDLMPYLLGRHEEEVGSGVPHPFLIHYCGDKVHAARYTPDADSGDVWKVHYATPNWVEGTEGCGYLCDCTGTDISWHDPPLLYNIGKDPSERNLLQAHQYPEIMELINNAVQNHLKSVESAGYIENQYAIRNFLPRPWLQPCCNFPYCQCSENTTTGH